MRDLNDTKEKCAEKKDTLGKNVELFFRELGQASMSPVALSYNGCTESESSLTYQRRVDYLYSNAAVDVYNLDDVQRKKVLSRIQEVKECQMYFDVPTEETVNRLLRDYNLQPYPKRNKLLLDDYNYCKFVLECVATQKNYLEKFTSLVEVKKFEVNGQDTLIDVPRNSDENSSIVEDKAWLSVDDVALTFRLPKNNIKSRQWRIDNKFPYDGFDQHKGAYAKVVFNRKHVEQWLEKKS